MRAVIDTYTAPNRTVLELHELIKSGEAAIDPLKEFAEAARARSCGRSPHDRRRIPCASRFRQRKLSPNIGRPLFDPTFVASSCKTSQCSAGGRSRS